MPSSSSSTANTSDGEKPPSTYPRGHWRPAEDEKLRRLVEKYGPQNWNSIAEKLDGRSGKSCRLRWFNQLDPRINKRPFTEEEEERLLAAHRAHGNKWALIARHFPGRTDNAVKNHWHVVRARRARERCRLLAKATASSFPATYRGGGGQVDFGGASAGGSICFGFSKPIISSSPAAPVPLFSSHGGVGASTSSKSLLSRYDGGKQPAMAPASSSLAVAFSPSSSPREAAVAPDHRHKKDSNYGGGGEPSSKTKVPFIDFLGVGMSSSTL